MDKDYSIHKSKRMWADSPQPWVLSVMDEELPYQKRFATFAEAVEYMDEDATKKYQEIMSYAWYH